jgi:hypothetical protein
MRILLLTGIICFVFFSCKKDEDEQSINHNVKGLWVGTYTVDQLPTQPALFYSFVIKPDGTLITEGKGANGVSYYAVGTWNVTGDSLKCTYTSLNAPPPQVTQSAKFHFNNSNGKLSSGTWKDGANGSNYTGTFPVMEKVY